MGQILYIQTDKNRRVASAHVALRDIAALACGDEAVKNRAGAVCIRKLPEGRYGRYTVSAVEIIAIVQRELSVDVTHIGEPDVILTYGDPAPAGALLSWCKTLLVCLITFFGTAFSIMTFNQDVDVSGLFDTIYLQCTGRGAPDGITALEVAYAVGIGLGVIFFFNHFGRWKLSHDPTPMEVEMRLYEDDVDRTVVEMRDRGM